MNTELNAVVEPIGVCAFPMSYAQQRLWVLDQLAPGNPFYNLHAAVPLTFNVQVDALRRALAEIVRRHESLRTTFGLIDGQPMQIVAPEIDTPLVVIDLRDMPAAHRQADVLRLATEEAQRPFVLTAGPLIRATLLRLGPADYILFLTLHHIVADGWSMQVFSRELNALYTAFATGRPSPLTDLPIQYADFAIWQREWLSGEAMARQLTYWRTQLHEASPLDLPTDRPRPAIATYRGATHALTLPAGLTQQLKVLSRREDCTLFMTLLAGFKALLGRYAGQDDIIVGSPVANRTLEETEGLIGFFVNMLVMRTAADGDPTFREWMRAVRQTALDAFSYQDLPFELLVDAIGAERDLSRNPLFQVTFQLLAAPGGVDAASGGRGGAGGGLAKPQGALPVQRGAAIFDLAMNLFDNGSVVSGSIEFSTDLFDASTIARMADHYVRLLASAVEQPDRPLSRLSLLDDASHRDVLAFGNDMTVPAPPVEDVVTLFERIARDHPTRLAVAEEGVELTYGALDRRANQWARYLRDAAGAGAGSVVAICLERSADLVTAALAAMKAGAAYLPLDPSDPAERVASVCQRAEARVLITRQRLADRLTLEGLTVPALALDLERDALARCDDRPLDAARAPDATATASPTSTTCDDRLAYVIYTSGSSGTPKGVEVGHHSLMNLVTWHQRAFAVTADDRATLLAGPAFDASVWEIWPYLTAGASIWPVPPDVRGTPAALIGWYRTHGITISFLPTALASLAFEEPWPADSTLRVLLTGGDRLPRHPPAGLPCAVYNNYGPTENTVVATSGRLAPSPATPAAAAATPGVPSIGTPIAHVQAYVVERGGSPAPLGVPGELWLGGASLARGYRGRPDLTEAAFVPNPFAGTPGDRLYRTGDRARRVADGRIQFLGRLDDQVKIRGVRIEPGEIEAALREHPSVQEAAVIARTDRQHAGSDGARLVAYVVADPRAHDSSAAAVGTEPGGLPDRRVEEWRALYEDVYAKGQAAADPAFNIHGWNSTYTGQPIPAAEMREWVEGAVARLRALRPRRVLEIGCGTGLLLFRLAPACETYHALDFSREALDYIGSHLDRFDLREIVRLEQRRADRLDDLPARHFDTVILNSVVQYFPSGGYLTDVIDAAVERLAPGGTLFIGDVRNLATLEAFHLAVALEQAGPTEAAAVVRDRARRAASQERELAIAPAFFAALTRTNKRVSDVRLTIKRGEARNELTQFRYDVRIGVEREQHSAQPERIVDWGASETPETQASPDASPLATIERLLANTAGALLVRGVPDARVAGAVSALSESGAATAAELRQRAASATGHAIDPERLWRLGAERDRLVEIGWTLSDGSSAAAGGVDVWFGATTASPADQGMALAAIAPEHVLPAAAYANNPLRRLLAEQLEPQLRERLRHRLPESMQPSAFVWLDRLPLTPNGKLDRRALPPPDDERPRVRQDYVEPRTPTERQLAGIWSQALGITQIGIDDNFFELGGDSILSIQIVSRATQAGLGLTATHMFQHQTIADLARALEHETSAHGTRSRDGVTDDAVSASLSAGPVVLTPIQRWFFDLELTDPHHFNQSVMLDMGPHANHRALTQALEDVRRTHAALCLAFTRKLDAPGAEAWQARYVTADDLSPIELSRHDCRGLAGDALDAYIQSSASTLQVSLDLETGRLIRAAFFEAAEASYLLIVIHHLVVDAVSWHVILEDLQAAYAHRLALPNTGNGAVAPLTSTLPRTAPFVAWGRDLARRADAEDVRSEMAFWRTQIAPPSPPLPRDGTAGADGGREGDGQREDAADRERRTNLVANARDLRVMLTVTETLQLVQDVPRVYHTRINDVLLTALLRAFAPWTGARSLLLHLEGHGREPLDTSLDLSRSVGWFTVMFPVRLTLPPGDAPGDALKAIKEQLRRVPRNGIGYGLLRYLSTDDTIRRELAGSAAPEVAFNYLGQLSAAPAASSASAATAATAPARRPAPPPEWCGPNRAPRARRHTVIEINSSITEGRLISTWTYSESLHQRATMASLAGRFAEELRTLVEHCRATEAGGFTPSDFANANLAQDELDRLLNRVASPRPARTGRRRAASPVGPASPEEHKSEDNR